MSALGHARNPADVYDEKFVPALFAHWGPIVAAEAQVSEGDRVLDVACGTGALTTTVAQIVGGAGSVTGLDVNPEMLAVARRKPLQVEWLEGSAESLPLPDNTFDAVVSQFGFMFFEDKPQALREMMRVLKPRGRLAVAVCDAVENSPGYNAFAQSLDRLFGSDVGNAFRAPFNLGNPNRLHEICREADMESPEIVQRNELVRFRSVEELVSTERACVWTLGGLLSDEQFERLMEEAEKNLRPFVIDGGAIEFDMPSLIINAMKLP